MTLANRDIHRVEEELVTIELHKIWMVSRIHKGPGGSQAISSRFSIDELSIHRPSYRDLVLHQIARLEDFKMLMCHCPESSTGFLC